MRSLLALLVVATLAAAQEEAEGADASVWVEHFDKQSGKPFFYNEVTRQTAWEAPPGAPVRYMDAASREGGDAEPKGGPGQGMVLLALLLPIGLPLLALLYCYWEASRQGLGDVLKGMKATRDRSAKRRSTKAGGNFRQRHKLSQDGKGGRSANS